MNIQKRIVLALVAIFCGNQVCSAGLFSRWLREDYRLGIQSSVPAVVVSAQPAVAQLPVQSVAPQITVAVQPKIPVQTGFLKNIWNSLPHKYVIGAVIVGGLGYVAYHIIKLYQAKAAEAQAARPEAKIPVEQNTMKTGALILVSYEVDGKKYEAWAYKAENGKYYFDRQCKKPVPTEGFQDLSLQGVTSVNPQQS